MTQNGHVVGHQSAIAMFVDKKLKEFAYDVSFLAIPSFRDSFSPSGSVANMVEALSVRRSERKSLWQVKNDRGGVSSTTFMCSL